MRTSRSSRAVDREPEFADAHYNLGRARHARDAAYRVDSSQVFQK